MFVESHTLDFGQLESSEKYTRCCLGFPRVVADNRYLDDVDDVNATD